MASMGRVWTIVLVLAVVILGVMVLFSTESPGSAGGRFMNSLMACDAKTAASLSHVEGKTTEELEKAWKSTFEGTKYYKFGYSIAGVDSPGTEGALVRLKVEKNLGQGSYDENFTLPMVKAKDGWKVDLASLNRDLYPWLPRFNR